MSSKDKIKGLLFDLDGVLVDTAVYHYKAWLRLAKTMGFTFSELQNEELKGISRMDSLDKVLAWGNVQKSAEEKLALATQKNDWYVEMINKMTPAEVLPGALNFLQQAKQAGYKMALGSASKNSATILKNTNLAHFFDAIVDGNSVSKSKPDPEVFLKGAQELALQPQQCVVFEDAEAGIIAAKRGGMKAIGIGDKNILKQADKVVAGLGQLSVKNLEEL
ncbi:beta-phosphoglucomutase [Pelobium manganitolerans]|uniref:Beta-phosphoglucomutase n=1 Tax=Pelobium manganitolerans TaxID=1842495 RepID=A0A419SBF3_9SPHI|nr:beta-phosphoglucomutase [Pelobium manganitolerans]RKD20149.1 beta-phosphoglucomutase [Pelobium manganitolerans]